MDTSGNMSIGMILGEIFVYAVGKKRSKYMKYYIHYKFDTEGEPPKKVPILMNIF